MAKSHEVAFRFVSEERCQETMARRYSELRSPFDELPPRERPLDAPSIAALAAVLEDPPVGLRAHAEGFRAMGDGIGRVDHLLHAADLFEIDGDLAAAHAALDLLEGHGTPEALRAASQRRGGLAMNEHLGTELVAMLLCWARTYPWAEHDDLIPEPLSSGVVRSAVSSALTLHGYDFAGGFDDASPGNRPNPMFGRYLGAVLVAGRELDPRLNPGAPRYARFATPWLRTLLPAGSPRPPGAVTPVAAVLGRAWSMVRWDLWRALVSPDREELDALIDAHPDFQEAHACRVRMPVPLGLAEVVAVVDPWLDRVTMPRLRASMLQARGVARTDAGQLTDGLADLDAALALDPGSLALRRARARNLNRQNRPDEAQAADPDNREVHGLRGALLLAAGRYDEAIAPLNLAIEHTPDDPDAWSNLGCCLRHLNETAEAREVLHHAVEMAPSNAAARFQRGMLFADLGRNAEARADLGQVVENLPPEAALASEARERLATLDAVLTPPLPDAPPASRSWVSRLDPTLLLLGLTVLALSLRAACVRLH